MTTVIEASEHARLSASSAERWLNCAGSVNLIASLPAAPGTTFAAAQGTYAHSIAADCLRNESTPPMAFLGQKAVVEGHEIECDEEMVEGVQLYLDTVLGLELALAWVEPVLYAGLEQLHSDFGGTADYVTYDPVQKLLRVVDFKYGAGVFVSADDNKQLKQYALGALLTLGANAHVVEVYIVQPRFEGAKPVRVEKFAAFDLMEFAGDLVEAAKATCRSDAPLTPGSWCKKTFCPATYTCPALEGMQHALVKAEFSEVISFDPKALGQTLSSITLVEERIKALKDFAYTQAVAGLKIPGWKLVDKKPRRHWTDQNAVIKWAKDRAVDPFAEPELKSPAQLEKGLKKGEKAELAQFTAAVSSGTTLVPEADARQEVNKMVTVDDFDVIGSPEVAPKQLRAVK